MISRHGKWRAIPTVTSIKVGHTSAHTASIGIYILAFPVKGSGFPRYGRRRMNVIDQSIVFTLVATRSVPHGTLRGWRIRG